MIGAEAGGKHSRQHCRSGALVLIKSISHPQVLALKLFGVDFIHSFIYFFLGDVCGTVGCSLLGCQSVLWGGSAHKIYLMGCEVCM